MYTVIWEENINGKRFIFIQYKKKRTSNST